MSGVIARGVVSVRNCVTGREWDEAVEVLEADVEWGNGMTVEDAARLIAREQAAVPVQIEGVDVS